MCPVACEGIYADVHHRFRCMKSYEGLLTVLYYRSLVTEDKQKDRETLALLRKEYQLYKDQWGLNLKYSHEAGESKNYSKILIFLFLEKHIFI